MSSTTRVADYDSFIESKRSLFGKFPEYSNKLFVTPIKDLQKSIGFSSKLLIAGIVSLGIELVSIVLSIKHVDAKYQALASGVSAGIGLYSFYISLQNKIFLPGNFDLMNKIGFGATIVSILSSGAQIGYLLSEVSNGGT